MINMLYFEYAKYHESEGCIGTSANTTDQTSVILQHSKYNMNVLTSSGVLKTLSIVVYMASCLPLQDQSLYHLQHSLFQLVGLYTFQSHNIVSLCVAMS